MRQWDKRNNKRHQLMLIDCMLTLQTADEMDKTTKRAVRANVESWNAKGDGQFSLAPDVKGVLSLCFFFFLRKWQQTIEWRRRNRGREGKWVFLPFLSASLILSILDSHSPTVCWLWLCRCAVWFALIFSRFANQSETDQKVEGKLGEFDRRVIKIMKITNCRGQKAEENEFVKLQWNWTKTETNWTERRRRRRSMEDWELRIEQSNKGNDDSWLTQWVELLNYENTETAQEREIGQWNWMELEWIELDPRSNEAYSSSCWLQSTANTHGSRQRRRKWVNEEWEWRMKLEGRRQIAHR